MSAHGFAGPARSSALAALATLLAGCAVGPNYKRPDTPVAPQFAGAEATRTIAGRSTRP